MRMDQSVVTTGLGHKCLQSYFGDLGPSHNCKCHNNNPRIIPYWSFCAVGAFSQYSPGEAVKRLSWGSGHLYAGNSQCAQIRRHSQKMPISTHRGSSALPEILCSCQRSVYDHFKMRAVEEGVASTSALLIERTLPLPTRQSPTITISA